MNDDKMLAETEPQKYLPRVLSSFDMLAIYFAIVFGSYGAAQLAAAGWAAVPMTILASITFLIPCALCAYELGTLFPNEGGIYVWAHKTLGPIHGFVSGWLSWVPIFLLLPLDVSIMSSFLQYILGQTWAIETNILVQIVLIGIIFATSIMKIKISKTLINIMFFVAIGTAILAFVSGILHSSAATPIDNEIFSLDLGKYGFLYSAAVLWLLGVEIPFNMSAEFGEHKKTGKTMLFWGTIAILLGYLMGIIGILLSTPIEQVDLTTAIARAVGSIWPIGGMIVAIGIIFAVFSQGVSTMNAYSRLPFVASIENLAPKNLSQISRDKTPINAMIIQAVGSILVVIIFVSQTQLAVTYNLYLAALVAIWCASLYYVYVAILKARNKFANNYTKETWKIPGGTIGLWSVVLIGLIFNTLAIYYVFAKPWTNEISSLDWLIGLGITCVVITILGLGIYHTQKNRSDARNYKNNN
ncbi:MAG: APC family permease [Candidatus Bilamarchaeum sp.]|jgi:amino acid transporter